MLHGAMRENVELPGDTPDACTVQRTQTVNSILVGSYGHAT